LQNDGALNFVQFFRDHSAAATTITTMIVIVIVVVVIVVVITKDSIDRKEACD